MARYNKTSLIEDLQLQAIFADATKKDITEFAEDFFNLLVRKVAAGDEVSIPGFGKFEQYELVSGVIKPKFTAFLDFKAAVNA